MSIELNKESVEQADASSCQGTNCGTTTGDHSSECLAEAAAGQGWELKPGDLCGRDCPIHKISAEQAGGDERAEFERAFTVQEGIYFDDKRGEYRSMNLRAIEASDALDLNLRLQGWQARAALAHRAPEVCSECSDTGKVYDESGDGPWSCYACTGNPEVIGYANGDELDNMLDDRTAVLSPGKTSFHTVPVYRLIRAALAQPSPTLPPFAEKVLAKLRRFNECAEDSDSGGVDIGRHWLDLLTQLGLLNRVQRSPALWEISQQGEDLLGLDVPEIEVPDSMIEKAWQRFERTLQQLETPGQAEQAEQAEAERPEVVGSLYLGGWADQEELEDNDVELDMKVVERLQVDLASKGDGVHMPLMTVAQHERITAQLHDALDESDGDRWKLRSERDAANARLHEVATACATAEQERDAALARVAELEMQEPVALANRGLHAFWVKWTEAAAGLYGPGIKLYAAPVAQAQQLHDLDKQCRDDVARALGLRPNQGRGFAWSYLLASIKSCVKASEDSAQAQHSVPELLVRAEDFVSGKEVPQAWLDVQAERRRQITAEGWTPEHDDLYCAAELPRAAAAYILNGANDEAPAIWPFSAKWWKPRDARSNYVRAGALILAEIERLDRAAHGKEVGHE
ncbi:TPA: hypothetical protein ACVGLB_004908 [Pseudomonas aeruginosa]